MDSRDSLRGEAKRRDSASLIPLDSAARFLHLIEIPLEARRSVPPTVPSVARASSRQLARGLDQEPGSLSHAFSAMIHFVLYCFLGSFVSKLTPFLPTVSVYFHAGAASSARGCSRSRRRNLDSRLALLGVARFLDGAPRRRRGFPT